MVLPSHWPVSSLYLSSRHLIIRTRVIPSNVFSQKPLVTSGKKTCYIYIIYIIYLIYLYMYIIYILYILYIYMYIKYVLYIYGLGDHTQQGECTSP